MSGRSICAKKLWVDPSSVVPDSQSQLPRIIADFNFEVLGSCVPEGVSQRLARNLINFISCDWKKISGPAFHFDMECWDIEIRPIGSQRLPERTNSANEVVADWDGRAQLLHGISPLNECLSSLVDGAVESTFRFIRTRTKQIGRCLEME